jgi:CheY-like chemotaxis protein
MRALIIANSPFEAPAMEARLEEAGASVGRAYGLDSGLEALKGPRKPDVVIVDCALGSGATNRLAQAAREAGVRRSLVLFSPFERRAFGQTALKGFDGWLVKPVRARSLFERVAWQGEPVARRASQLSPSPQVGRALVAEDNDINALITQKALHRLGFEVVRALDGDEALRLASPIAPLESRPFDIILMDLKMPGVDGYEATLRLRRLEAACGWSPTPIIALTANAFDEQRGSPSAAGFDAFLIKPVEFRALASTVERVCAAHTAPWRERLRA